MSWDYWFVWCGGRGEGVEVYIGICDERLCDISPGVYLIPLYVICILIPLPDLNTYYPSAYLSAFSSAYPSV